MRAIETVLPTDLATAEPAVRAALADEGFGVLTEIDVAATLREKLGVEREPLKILGACNPTLANRALERDPSVALLLPCNVVLAAAGGATRVSAVDPHELMPGDEFRDLADEAAGKLRAAIDALSTSG
jgi:uncharacterized protein (DUF302 family)